MEIGMAKQYIVLTSSCGALNQARAAQYGTSGKPHKSIGAAKQEADKVPAYCKRNGYSSPPAVYIAEVVAEAALKAVWK